MTPRFALLAAAMATTGCDSSRKVEPNMPAPVSASSSSNALNADSNRDGVIDESDRPGHGDWTATSGAIFLANLDDDDGDGKADASDMVVNGPADELDLARIQIATWPQATTTATATITVEPDAAAMSVHLFRHDGADWTLLSASNALATADLTSGLELGIEATNFASSAKTTAWDGTVVVHLVVADGGQTIAEDKVKLRVAPFVMVSNLSALAEVWDAPLGDDGSDAFVSDIVTLAGAASVTEQEASFDDPNSLDQWAEDWWQIGHTWMPAANGATQGMLVAQRSAQPDRPAGAFAATQLGHDFAFIWPHTNSKNGQSDPSAYSLDSFGDHDTIPPYSKGVESYPLGRILIGGNSNTHIDPVVRDFYDAQRVQPVFQVDTTFLDVGHVDEIFSYVPAATPRGWKLLVASPKLARTMLTGWQTAGQGATAMFVGEYFYDDKGKPLAATVSISDLLADPEIMAASDQAQTGIDGALAALKAEVGLDDSEIVELPILFERIFDGSEYKVVAHMVGTVNMRVVNGNLGIPRPHGPTIGGADALEQDIQDRLGTAANQLGKDGMGLPITFVEDWVDYHAAEGEVHCGSNVAAQPMPNTAWWEAGR